MSTISVQMLLTLLSTSAIAALIGAFTALRVAPNTYVNEYYKTIIGKRIVAYEHLETLIVGLKTCVVDESDHRPYHLMLASEENEAWERVFVVLGDVMAQGLWLTDETFQKTRDLNLLLFHQNKPASVIEFAKKNYQAIATLRADLERLLARDMLKLHDVRWFLRSKNRSDIGFHEVRLKD